MKKLICFALCIIWFSLNLQSRNLHSNFEEEFANNIFSENSSSENDILLGEGTELSPYQISTIADLHYLSQTPAIWDAHF